MSSVERLDFSKPPPGTWADETVWDGSGQPPGDDECFSWGHLLEDGVGFYKHLEEAIAAAWAHYKARHDPPGMETRRGPFGFGFVVGRDSPIYGAHDEWPQARAAAWAWYERRLSVTEALCGRALPRDFTSNGLYIPTNGVRFWPEALAWPDEHVAEVERWLTEGGEVPEVLRG